MPSSAFFSLFHKQKKFTESVFSKLFANPYASLITADFTNHFCLLYLIFSTTSYAQVAPVNPPSGGFNINGGLKANTSVGDWVKGTGTGGFVLNDGGSAPNTATTGLQRDAYNSGSDFIFTTGSKFNDIIPNLQWTQSSAPNKNDINNAMYHVSQDPALNANGGHDQWIMIGGDRLSTSGTAILILNFYKTH